MLQLNQLFLRKKKHKKAQECIYDNRFSSLYANATFSCERKISTELKTATQ